MLCHHYFVHLHANTFRTDNLDTVSHALQGLKGLILNLEVQLRGKADAAQHAQGVVRESDLRVQRRSDDAVLQVCQSIERIDQFAKPRLVQADSHRINGKVTTILVVLQCSVIHNGLT